MMDDGFKNRAFWLAGELAKAAGVSTDTLRHYERKGVLNRPPRAGNGYRHYPGNALEQILLIRKALSVGFTLDELARIFGERRKGGAPCRKVRGLAAEKLQNVEEQIIALGALRDELRLILGDWDARLAAVDSGTRVGLLETLVSRAEPDGKRTGAAGKRKPSPQPKSKQKGR